MSHSPEAPVKPHIRTSPSLVPHPLWGCASCCSCSSSLCALPRGVTDSSRDGCSGWNWSWVPGTAGGVGNSQAGQREQPGKDLCPIHWDPEDAQHYSKRTFGVCNSFLEILSSYCIREKKTKQNQCLSREAIPNPSGREGSFRSCFYPHSLSYSLPWSGTLLLSPLFNLGTSWHTNALLTTVSLVLELPCAGTDDMSKDTWESTVSAEMISTFSAVLIIGPATDHS